MQQLFPFSESVPEREAYLRLQLPRGQRAYPYVLLNMVASVDGKATLMGKAAGLGSSTDHDLMRQLRAQADAVLSGAGTLREEAFHTVLPPPLQSWRQQRGLSPNPIGVVASNSARLPLEHPFFQEAFPRVVILPEDADAERVAIIGRLAQVLQAGKGGVDLPLALQRLSTDFGVSLLVAEGGPKMAEALFRRGLVDELFFTLAPKVLGGTGRFLVEGQEALPDSAHLELVGLLLADSELFLRYRVKRGH